MGITEEVKVLLELVDDNVIVSYKGDRQKVINMLYGSVINLIDAVPAPMDVKMTELIGLHELGIKSLRESHNEQ